MKSPSFSASRRFLFTGRLANAGREDEVAPVAGNATASSDASHSDPFTVSLSSKRIEVEGVIGEGGEPVAFAGPVDIRARAVTGSDIRRPSEVTLVIDFSALCGAGQASGMRYVSAHQETVIRMLAGSREHIDVDFIFYPEGSDEFSRCRTGAASFSLAFHLPSLNIAAARGSIGRVQAAHS